jgi:dUTP pyrophosphatase
MDINANMKIKIKKLKEDSKLPSYAHPGDVGMDLFSMETFTIEPGGHHFFYHGFAMEFSEGYAAIVKDKSSISKIGLHTMGGVFDAGYRGEYNTHLVNLSSEPYTVEEGDKVSQLIIYPVAIAELEEVNELGESSRGMGAFGSTGRK